MPKRPKFEIKETAKGWRLNVPASISSDGKRQRLYYKTRTAARKKRSELSAEYHEHGSNAATITPMLAEAATTASQLLKPYGVGLVEAVKNYVGILESRSRSISLGEAIDRWEESTAQLREKTLAGYRDSTRKLEHLRETLVADVTQEDIEGALASDSPSTFKGHIRNVGVLFRFAERKGWCDAGFLKRIETPTPQAAEIGVLRVPEVRALLKAAEKHYPDTVPAFALALFAGIRIEELQRLTWADVEDEGINVSRDTAKKRKRRFVGMNPTLKAWLAGHSFEDESAPIVPGNWKEKYKAVRRLAGWKVSARLLKEPPELKASAKRWPQNAMRHTHASAAVRTGTSLMDLIFEFGHSGGEELLREHYVGRYRKKDAIAFWEIGPKGTKIESKRVA